MTTKKTQPFQTLEEYQSYIKKYTKEALAKYTKEVVAQKINYLLETGLESIVAQAIGFEYRWEKWEVNHTNGREPAITQMVSSLIKPIVQEVIDSYQFKPTEGMISALKAEYRDRWVDCLQFAVWDRVSTEIAASVDKIMGVGDE